MMDSISASIGKQIANLKMQTLALSRQDTLLESRITDLHNYVDEQIAVQALVTQQGIKALTDSLAAAQDGLSQRIQEEVAALSNAISASQAEVVLWTQQTFATLEQYDSTCVSIAGIQARVSMTEHGLDSLAQQLNATRETLTQEYSQALTQAIGNLETSLKTWVNERLTGYYTIAETDAHLSALTDTISANNQKLAQRIVQLQDSLDHAKAELTKEYQAAIQTAIAEEDGVITKKIADEVAAINSRIDTEVAAINASIQSLSDRVTALEQEVADLKKIPEITFSETNPSYIPGDVVTIGFTLTNADENTLVETIADAGWKAVVTMDNYAKGSIKVTTSNTGGQGKVLVFVNKGGYTIMRALLFDEGVVTIVDNAHTVMPQDTTLVVTLATNLPDYKVVIPEDAQAWLALLPSTKAAMREEVLMFDIAQNLTSKARSAVIKVVSTGNETLLASISIYQLADVMGLNEIWYTSTDGQIVTPTDPNAFHANIVSNTYANGKGIIRFDADVDRVAVDAFRECSTLRSISLPDGVKSIGNLAFHNCRNLISINLSQNLISIGEGSFQYCAFSSVVLPETLSSIGSSAFSRCEALTSIIIPEGITSISCFTGCINLKTITLPESLKSIAGCNYCTSLSSIVLPNGLKEIGVAAFANCTSLSSITFSDSLSSIGRMAFQNCSSLTSLALPSELVSIGNQVFEGCSNLVSVLLPTKLQSIGTRSFNNCKKLEAITLNTFDAPFISSNSFEECYVESIKLIIPRGQKSKYESISLWKDFGLITESDYEPEITCEVVDLGLSVNWATCDLGANTPYEEGWTYMWGSVLHMNSSWTTYPWCNGSSNSITKYNTQSTYGFVDNMITIAPEDDIAHIRWGDNWRMPTKGEFDELINNCTWTKTTQNGVTGYKVTSNIAGFTDRSIFFSLANSSASYYWSGSLIADKPNCASTLDIEPSYCMIRGDFDRISCNRIRPVCFSSDWLASLSITLNVSSQTIILGGDYQLSTTIKSGNKIINHEVRWASDNPSVATVDNDGKVSALSCGEARISASIENITATCLISVEEYVDLGLSVKWAICNIGASVPEEAGEYFAWGETESKEEYSWNTYKYGESPFAITKYNSEDKAKVLAQEDDAANVKWGGSWRMPSYAEYVELLTECSWKWKTMNGVDGYQVTSKVDGYTDRSIFLPAVGSRAENYINDGFGLYWTNTLQNFDNDVRCMIFSADPVSSVILYNRECGCSVRPVCP